MLDDKHVGTWCERCDRGACEVKVHTFGEAQLSEVQRERRGNVTQLDVFVVVIEIRSSCGKFCRRRRGGIIHDFGNHQVVLPYRDIGCSDGKLHRRRPI